MRGITISFPGVLALDNVDFFLRPGEVHSIMGENGAGKSTLVKLLLRLYDPSEGAIRWGGVDLRDMDPADLRGRIGAVFQDFVRYQFSAAENVGLGNPAHVADRPRIVEAARRAGATALVEALPGGWDTVLGGWFEAGHELSAGQWQKLAVARAFARQAALLILDEPTSNLDARAEYNLFRRFHELAKGRTTIIISHRFSTVRVADRILVMDKGRIVEEGTHAELIAKGGLYARLAEMQFAAEAAE
jgi:ATP-binding cassette subfamily B protein/ATP-binding cassette subfamily C protein